MKDKLTELVKRQQEIYELIGDLNYELKEVNKKIGQIEFGYDVGDRIKFNGKLGVVTEFETFCMIVNLITKKGEPSKVATRIYKSDMKYIEKVEL